MSSIFIILSTNNIGGAEKRFFGLWKAFMEAEHFFCKLVLTPILFEAFQKQENSSYVLKAYQNNIIQAELSSGFKNFQSAIKSFIDQTQPDDILHFVGDHPLLLTLKRKQVFSITQSSLKNLNLPGKLGQLTGVICSDLVDVLDPVVYIQLQRIFFYKRKKIHRTSNSFCDSEFFYSVPFEQKNNWLVFLGRFEYMKQVTALLNAVPAIYHVLQGMTISDVHFYFFGYGSLESKMKEMLQAERFRNVPITIEFNNKPNLILARSKIFFSLQLHNNYPSKSLIEAMSAGNIPVVTDVGQTRWLARPQFSYYVPEYFKEENLVQAITQIYTDDKNSLAEKSRSARQFVMSEHTIEKMRDYYLRLYKGLTRDSNNVY
jgi:glycosyltransferase involved in cell wall biosynthesis